MWRSLRTLLSYNTEGKNRKNQLCTCFHDVSSSCWKLTRVAQHKMACFGCFYAQTSTTNKDGRLISCLLIPEKRSLHGRTHTIQVVKQPTTNNKTAEKHRTKKIGKQQPFYSIIRNPKSADTNDILTWHCMTLRYSGFLNAFCSQIFSEHLRFQSRTKETT